MTTLSWILLGVVWFATLCWAHFAGGDAERRRRFIEDQAKAAERRAMSDDDRNLEDFFDGDDAALGRFLTHQKAKP
jgi:hypothetical protein